MTVDVRSPVDLSQPSLAALSYLLRHHDLWPKDYRWDFDNVCLPIEENYVLGFRRHGIFGRNTPIYGVRHCGTHGCAIGLTYETWPDTMKLPDQPVDNAAAAYGIPAMDAYCLFYETETYYRGLPHQHITPLMVADAIDAYLAL